MYLQYTPPTPNRDIQIPPKPRSICRVRPIQVRLRLPAYRSSDIDAEDIFRTPRRGRSLDSRGRPPLLLSRISSHYPDLFAENIGAPSLLSPISILRVASLLGRSRLADSSFLPPTRAEMFLPDLLRPLNAPSYHRRENRTHATHAMAKSRPASAPRYLHHFRATEVASYKKLDPDYSTRQLNR